MWPPGHRRRLHARPIPRRPPGDSLDDGLGEVVGHALGEHLLSRPPEEGERMHVGVDVGAVLVHLHGRAGETEEDAAQLVRFAADRLGRALPGDVPYRADHVRCPAAPIREQHALVGHGGPGAVATAQTVLTGERQPVQDAVRQGLHRRVVIVQVDALEPPFDAAWEAAHGQVEHLVDPVGEGNRPGLDVPVVEHVEGHVEEGLQALVAGGDGRLRLGTRVTGRRDRDVGVSGRQDVAKRRRDPEARHYLSIASYSPRLVRRHSTTRVGVSQ